LIHIDGKIQRQKYKTLRTGGERKAGREGLRESRNLSSVLCRTLRKSGLLRREKRF